MGEAVPWCFYCDLTFENQEAREQHELDCHSDHFMKYKGPDIPKVK